MLSKFLDTHSSIQGALPVLIDASLKGAILVLIAACAAYVLRNRSASSRHAAWTAAVIGHLAIPALVLFLPAWSIPLLPQVSWMRVGSPQTIAAPAVNSRGATSPSDAGTTVTPTSASEKSGTVASVSSNTQTSTAGQPAANAVSPSRPGIVPIIAAIWLVGATLVLLRLAFGTWRVGQLARDGARVEDGVWLSLTQRLANKLGVTRPLILLRGERLAVPVTWGIVYPAVLLPQDADSWSEERRRFVLVHEMAHVKRFDALTQLLAQISVAVFWFDPLVWLAAHRMRVEREHACDDYVLRDGTTPSLYAGELLEMVRSIGTPSHDTAAPAFAALAMARRSEFEGRMLAILDPRLDRHTLSRRGTLLTAVVVALLTIPLAALRPYQQPSIAKEDLPPSFKISISEAPPKPATVAADATPLATAPSQSMFPPSLIAAKPSTSTSSVNGVQIRYSCEAYPVGTVLQGTSTHISQHNDGGNRKVDYLVSEPGRCVEATVVGVAEFSPDETRLAQLSAGAFARFRERTSAADRAVSAVPVGDGSISYTATVDGKPVPFDATMQAWLAKFLPQFLREAGLNVPERVARLRAQGGVAAVLREIAQMRSSGAKASHYEELIKSTPTLSSADLVKITQQVPRDLTSSGDLSRILQMLPRSTLQNPSARESIASALTQIKSSGDRANTLQILAPNADAELLLLLARAAEDLPSSGDKANFLITTASQYLTPRSQPLRNAFFKTASTLQSSGDMANVLISAMPYGHSSPEVTLQVVETSKGLKSSGDAANVLILLASQGLLKSSAPGATMAAIERTLTMRSSGDRANVLISIAGARVLSTADVREAFTRATMALPSDGDRSNVLAAAANR